MHDGVHRSLCTSSFWNDVLGFLYGSTCLLPFEQWRSSHLEHHYWAGNIDSDPVMAIAKNWSQMPKNSRKLLNVVWKSWIPLMAVAQYLLFWALAVKQSKNLGSTRRGFAVASLAGPLAFVCLLLFLSSQNPFFGLAIILGFTGYFALVEAVNFPHHLEMPHLHNSERRGPWAQESLARSCDYPEWIGRHLTLHFNLHVEHHLFPDLPWHRLPEAKSVLLLENVPHLRDASFEWIRRNRRKNLEDVISPPSQDLENRPLKEALAG